MKLQSTLAALVCSALAAGDSFAQTVASESQAPSPPAVPAAADSARVVLLPLSRGLLADVVAGGAGAEAGASLCKAVTRGLRCVVTMASVIGWRCLPMWRRLWRCAGDRPWGSLPSGLILRAYGLVAMYF